MKKIFTIIAAFVLFFGCVTDPLTGESTMALVSNSELFPSSFAQYDTFLNENTVVTGTANADMVARVGAKLAEAAQKWYVAAGAPDYLNDYQWEYHLVQDDTVNAWCMPGGKIVVYSGILPVTQTEAGLAVVLGHEVAHALRNHGQQRMSTDLLQQLGGTGISAGSSALGLSTENQALAMSAYGIASDLAVAKPFSRDHENDADHYGLMLMAIAGYDPDEAAPFWERMTAQGGGGIPEFLSTHPSNETRIRNIQRWTAEAKQKAAEFGVQF